VRSRSVPALLSGPLAGGLISRLGRRRGEEAIRAAVVAAIHGFNAHDAKRATQAYMPESDLVTVRVDVLKGRAEIKNAQLGCSSPDFDTRHKRCSMSESGSLPRMWRWRTPASK
jgi:hypothetical protein